MKVDELGATEQIMSARVVVTCSRL